MPLTNNPNVAVSADASNSLDVVIVNWNSGTCLRECIAALDRSTIAAQIEVVVVDNASGDGSSENLAAERCHLKVVSNSKNQGFAVACNQGSRHGRAPVLLFLNPDVRVDPETLAQALGFLNHPNNRNVGVLGVQLLNSARQLQRSCARTPTLPTLLAQTMFLDRLCPRLAPPHFMIEWDHADTRPVDQVMGACLFTRRPLFQRIGGFDERFFLYYEDVELCAAARQLGALVVYFSAAQAIHIGGASSGMVQDRRLYYLLNSKAKYTAKHYGQGAAKLLTVLIFLFEFPLRWLHATLYRSRAEARLIIRGIALFGHDWLRNRCRIT